MHSPNNPSPLLPQGVLMDQKNSSRSRVKLAFFCVVGVHVAGLLVLLMQGCKRENANSPDTGTQTGGGPSVPIVASNTQPTDIAAPTNPATADINPPPSTVVTPPAPPPATAQEYAIQKGDSFYTIAKKFNVTQKAIQEANPGVDPLKLQVNQKIKIPAPAPTTVAAVTNGGTLPTGETVYVVKSGDVLGTIAAHYKVTVNAIMQANNITDPKKIRVGQPLKIPKAATTPAPPPP